MLYNPDWQDFEAAKSKAMKCGAAGFFLEDLKREFVEQLIYRESVPPI
jgi:argininosuccinate synthase